MRRSFLTRILAAVLLAAGAQAQLDLPKDANKGSAGKAGAGGDGLDLPSASPGEAAGSAGAEAGAPESLPSAAENAAEFVVREVRRLSDPDAPLARNAALSLGAMGADGLSAARAMLVVDHAPTAATGARVLLGYGGPSDAEAVLGRLLGKLPSGAAEPMLDGLRELAPQRATPSFLMGLLDHTQGGMRAAAHRALRSRAEPSWLPELAELLSSRRADTRLRCLELLSEIESPERTTLLLRQLGDTASKVAWRSASLLAFVDDPGVEPALVDLAFAAGRLTRHGAYALLAIAEREDRLGQGLLGAAHVEPLLEELSSQNPLLGGSAAVALAGIGFRSGDPASSWWIDREVPHVLVKAVSGADFHSDFSSVRGPAQRRLSLLSGQHFGSDGLAWRDWWVGAASTFKARRAVIAVDPTSSLRLELYYRSAEDGEAFHLLGPEASEREAADRNLTGRFGDGFFLSPADARQLFETLRTEGLFDARRLPGLRGRTSSKASTLEIAVGEQEKSFTLGEGSAAQPWFDRVAAVARALRDRNAWQRYRDPRRHETRRELWEAERSWWEEDHDPLERDLRSKTLLLASLQGSDPLGREAGLRELARLYARPGVPDGADFEPLLELLAQEAFHGPRATLLAGLAVDAARAGGRGLAAGPADRLIGVLVQTFQGDATEDIAAVLEASGPSALNAAAQHPSSAVRAAAAGVLGRRLERSSGERDAGEVALLRSLLADPSRLVEAAATRGLGRARVQEARAEIQDRAASAPVSVRADALRAVGRLGGEEASGVLLQGLTAPDELLQLAAVEGLAELGDSTTAPILVQVLARGPYSPLFEAARQGLLRLGEDAWSDLLRTAQSGSPGSRREAALLLSEQLCADVVTVLIMILTEDPEDAEVAWELAVLTAADLSDHESPGLAWWDWWDQVPRSDRASWLVRALRRLGMATPEPEVLSGDGSRAGALLLLQVLARTEPHLVERARRELALLLEREISEPPEPGPLRGDWLAEIRADVDRRFPQ